MFLRFTLRKHQTFHEIEKQTNFINISLSTLCFTHQIKTRFTEFKINAINKIRCNEENFLSFF